MPLALRWLMWSRRRAAGVLGLALVVIIGLTRLLAASHAPTPPSAAAPAPAAPSTPPSPSAPACAPAQPPPPKATPVTISTEFASRWVDHGGDPTCWLTALRPWSTDAYGTQVLPTVDPSTVPASRVNGTARLASQHGRAAEVTVPLDRLSIRVSLLDVTGAGAWRVNDLNPDMPGGTP